MDTRTTTELIELRPRLMRRARQLGLSREDAEDAVQDVCVAAITSRCSLSGPDLSAWCHVVLRNCAFGLGRTAHARRIVSVPSHDQMLEQTMLPAQDHVVMLRQVTKTMAAMPARAARLIMSIRVEGMSLEEAAEVEGVAVGTIKSGLHRAQAKLRRGLERSARKRCA